MVSRASVEEGMEFIAQDLVECILDLPRTDRMAHGTESAFAYDMRVLIDGADQWSYYGAFATDEAKFEALRRVRIFAENYVRSEAFQLALTK